MRTPRFSPEQGDRLRTLARVAAVLAAVWFTAGCGGGGGGGGAARSAELTFETGERLELTPGALRARDARAPLLWSAIPSPRFTAEAGSEDPPSRSVRIANIAPEANPDILESRYLSGSQREGCEGEPTGAVDCSSSDDPLCRALSFSHSFGAPTEAILRVDLPACSRLRIQLDVTVDRSSPLRVALLGPEVPTHRLGALLDHAAKRARLALLSGDHPEASDEESLADVVDQLRERSIPVVVTPGEEERIGGSTSDFQNAFGPLQISFELGATQFLVFESSRQSLGDGGIRQLQSRLQNLERTDPIVAITHTPPVDPEGLRGAGFRSEIEAARTLSLLSTYRTDLLLAGHLPGRYRDSYDGVELAIPAPGSDGNYDLVTLTPRTAGADSKLAVDSETVGP